MSPNNYQPHLLVLPEDDANSDIANGFLLEPNLKLRTMQILPPAGGWSHVRDVFQNDHIQDMRRFSYRNMVLLIDFDRRYSHRFNHVKGVIPPDLDPRVFVLGVLSDPEELKRTVNKSYEEIGKALSQKCCDGTRQVWSTIF